MFLRFGLAVLICIGTTASGLGDIVVEVGSKTVALSSLPAVGTTQIELPVTLAPGAGVTGIRGFTLYFDVIFNGTDDIDDELNPPPVLPAEVTLPSPVFNSALLPNTAALGSAAIHDIELAGDVSTATNVVNGTLLFNLLIDLGPSGNFQVGDFIEVRTENPFGGGLAALADQNNTEMLSITSASTGRISIVPEPSSFLLIGVIGCGWAVYRRARGRRVAS